MKTPIIRLPLKKDMALLSENIVRAIVDEAHKQGYKVAAHIGEAKGAKIALTPALMNGHMFHATLSPMHC